MAQVTLEGKEIPRECAECRFRYKCPTYGDPCDYDVWEAFCEGKLHPPIKEHYDTDSSRRKQKERMTTK
jgi:hypothetical protein